DRPLTIRESATLQTFPQSFAFHGSQADRMQPNGNTLPTRFPEEVARNLYYDYTQAKTGLHPVGALLRFVPTLSQGMSPALADVARRVRSQFVEGARVEQAMLWD